MGILWPRPAARSSWDFTGTSMQSLLLYTQVPEFGPKSLAGAAGSLLLSGMELSGPAQGVPQSAPWNIPRTLGLIPPARPISFQSNSLAKKELNFLAG